MLCSRFVVCLLMFFAEYFVCSLNRLVGVEFLLIHADRFALVLVADKIIGRGLACEGLGS